MKQIFNGAVVVSVIIGVALPVGVFAAPAKESKLEPEAGISLSCTQLNKLAASGKNTISQRIKAMDTDFSKRLKGTSVRFDAINQNISTDRTNTLDKLQAQVVQLKRKDDLTESQFDAITTYDKTIRKAETTRRASVDEARDSYLFNLLHELRNYQHSLKGAAKTFQTSTNTIFNKATSNCENRVPINTLQDSIKQARETLKEKRAFKAHQDKISEYATAQNSVIIDANKTFSTAAEKYADTLSSALDS